MTRPLHPRFRDVAALSAEEIQARLLHRDALVLILDKPAGLPVHPGPGGGATLVDSFEALRFGLPSLPQLAHRLDRETSGCLALGRNRFGLNRLGELFARGEARKTYWAIVHGVPPERTGVVALPLKKRSDDRRSWRMQVADDGQPAETAYEILGGNGSTTWLALTPKTGRTHQLRVHCAAIGCPIVGDWIYGDRDQRAQALLHLQARALELPFHPGKPPISVTAPPPPHMMAALKACGYQDPES